MSHDGESWVKNSVALGVFEVKYALLCSCYRKSIAFSGYFQPGRHSDKACNCLRSAVVAQTQSAFGGSKRIGRGIEAAMNVAGRSDQADFAGNDAIVGVLWTSNRAIGMVGFEHGYAV